MSRLKLQTLRAVFNDEARASDATGRLQVAGVPAQNITQSRDPLNGPRHGVNDIVVTARVDSTHYEKALQILSAEGRVTR